MYSLFGGQKKGIYNWQIGGSFLLSSVKLFESMEAIGSFFEGAVPQVL